MAILMLHRAEAAYAEDRVEAPIPEEHIPAPGPRLRPRRLPVEAAANQITARPNGSCVVRITGERPTGQPLYCVVVDGESGVRLDSREIPGPLPRTLTLAPIPKGVHELRLAHCPDHCGRSYVDKARVEITGDATPGEAELTCTLRPLQIRLVGATGDGATEDGAPAAGIAVLLHRNDDAQWRYTDPKSGSGVVLTDASGRARFAGLGPGAYTLTFHGFVPETADRQRLNFTLDRFDQGRPIRGRAQ